MREANLVQQRENLRDLNAPRKGGAVIAVAMNEKILPQRASELFLNCSTVRDGGGSFLKKEKV